MYHVFLAQIFHKVQIIHSDEFSFCTWILTSSNWIIISDIQRTKLHLL